MKNTKNTNRIVMNQYLIPSPVFSRIESPLILSALLVGLLILTACGGAAAIPTSFVNPNTFNSNSGGDLGDGLNNRQLQPDTDPEPDPGPDTVTGSDWTTSFSSPLAVIDTSNRRNQFLQHIPSDDTTDRRASYFSSITWDGAALGTNNKSYISYGSFSKSRDAGRAGTISETFYYVGIPENADMGLPLAVYQTGDTVSANWNGSFGFRTDFTLEINFKDSKVEAFVKGVADNYYHLNGVYNAGGVISGTVNYGTFSDIDARTPTDNRAANAVLTGLIGQDGAVGVFVSGTSTDGGVTITGGEGDDGFSGRFFAHPAATYNPKVILSDWRRSFATPLPPIDKTNRRNQFLASRQFDQYERSGTIIGSFDDIERLQATPFYGTVESNGGTRFYYADISQGDGLPLPAYETGNPVSADWNGRFNAVNGETGEANTDFALTVNFRDSTIEAFVKQGTTSNYYHIKGNYANIAARNADGIITGTVNYGTFSDIDARTPTNNRANNGVLTGLIGQDGARAAFVSGTTNDGGLTITGGTGDDGFAGGFWASPTVTYDPNVTVGDWRRSFATPLSPIDTTNPRNQLAHSITPKFHSTADVIIVDLANGRGGFPNIEFDGYGDDFGYRWNRGLNASFATGTINGTRYYYTTLLIPFFNTRLTTPLPVFETGNTVSADWNGHLSAYHGAAGETDTDFALTVNFRDSTVEAFVKQGTTSNYYHIKGRYNTNEIDSNYDTQAVISGTVNYGTFSDVDARTPTNNRAANGVLTGIIAQNRAIAGFVSGTTSDGGVTIEGGTGIAGFAGGFWASPTTNYVVIAADWWRSFSPALPTTDRTNRRNQFVTSLSTSGLTDADSDSINMRDATFNGKELRGHSHNGIHFAAGTDDDEIFYYATIDNRAYLGEVLPEFQTGNTASARWKGQFKAYEGATGEVETDFTLEVNFENSRLFAFIDPTGGRGDYNMNATYNADGVISGTITRGFNTHGLVTGLIGQNGAIGAFVSGASTDLGVTITGGTGENGYVGGFVACPYDDANNRCQQ